MNLRPVRGRILNHIAMLAIVASAGATAVAGAADDEPYRFGDFRIQVDGLLAPADIAIDDDDRIWVAEAAANRVRCFQPDGTEVGTSITDVLDPAGLALDDDQIFISERGRHRISVHAADGTRLRTFGGLGTGEGQLFRPAGLVVVEDEVFVADAGNSRVQVFAIDGSFRRTLGSAGRDEGQMLRPRDVTINADGEIVVVDADNHRIQVFDTDGTLINAWGDYGPFVGLMDEPGTIVARDDRYYVADENNHRIQIFDDEGSQIYEWGTHAINPHEGEGKLHYPNIIAIAPSRQFAVIGEHFEDRMQIFDNAPPGVSESELDRGFQPAVEATHFGTRLATDANLLVIGEPETHQVFVFRLDRQIPILVTQFGFRGDQFSQFMRTAGVIVDAESRTMHIVDSALGRMQEFELLFDPNERLRMVPFAGNLIRSFAFDDMLDGVISLERHVKPIQVRRHTDGSFWILDAANTMLHVFDADMRWLRSLGGTTLPDGTTWEPTDFTFAPDGDEVFVVDSVGASIISFKADGSFVRRNQLSSITRPFGILIRSDGSALLTDLATHRLVETDASFNELGTWAEKGADDGQLWKPGGIVETAEGHIMVADFGNHRCQIFDAQGQWQVTFGLGRASTRDRPRRNQ